MTENEDHLPLGDGMYVDTSGITVGHFALSEDSEIADCCLQACDPEGLLNYTGHQATAQFCMVNALRGGGQQEMIIDVRIQCEGPKRKLFGRIKCGANVAVRQIVKPMDVDSDEGDPLD